MPEPNINFRFDQVRDTIEDKLSDVNEYIQEELYDLEASVRTPGQIVAEEIAKRDLIVPLMVGAPFLIGMMAGAMLALSI
ncbi:hypothetical protein [Nitrosomonas halophila]|uniref:Uncharacterized protein n=1 Tax=Nitrosomonas halophila TaxID=44576 RepID=A0A1H3FC69_9PROT|nr:hypothetical protein [Nitrosomonas halophila]SDX88653.1 hypothetical protein SAMN05421881_101152 [Nitrosomonas halophila]